MIGEEFVLSIIITMIFVNNIVLTQGLGICPSINYAKGAKKSLALGLIVTFAMVITCAIIHPIEKYFLFEYKLEYLQTMIFVPIIFIVGFIISKLMKKTMPNIYEELGCVGNLITTNCAVFGLVLINIQGRYNLIETLLVAFATGLGFTLAMILFSSMRSRIESAPLIPEAFKGVPIALFAMAILSLIFMSFSGVAIGILGIGI